MNYLEGHARRPHSHSKALSKSLEGAEESTATGVCSQCSPILSRYADVFKSMVHTGTELKKRKRINPHPKRGETELTHYRDITRQNEWLQSNFFDSLGNYLYSSNCIKTSLKLSNDRLAHQRSIKRDQSQVPIVKQRSRRNASVIMSSCLLTLKPLLRGGGEKLPLELLWKSGIPMPGTVTPGKPPTQPNQRLWKIS